MTAAARIRQEASLGAWTACASLATALLEFLLLLSAETGPLLYYAG